MRLKAKDKVQGNASAVIGGSDAIPLVIFIMVVN